MNKVELLKMLEISEKLYRQFSSDSISPREIEIIREYTGCKDIMIGCLEKVLLSHVTKKSELEYLIDNIKHNTRYENVCISNDKIEIFLNSLKRHTLPCDLVLYRGTNRFHFSCTNDILNNTDSLGQGDIFTNFVPLSTTLFKGLAFDFAQIYEHPIVLEIHIPSNFLGLWTKPFSFYGSENEILLPSDLFFEVEETIKHPGLDEDGLSNYYIIKPVIGGAYGKK